MRQTHTLRETHQKTHEQRHCGDTQRANKANFLIVPLISWAKHIQSTTPLDPSSMLGTRTNLVNTRFGVGVVLGSGRGDRKSPFRL